jgi:hypothetical protein
MKAHVQNLAAMLAGCLMIAAPVLLAAAGMVKG